MECYAYSFSKVTHRDLAHFTCGSSISSISIPAASMPDGRNHRGPMRLRLLSARAQHVAVRGALRGGFQDEIQDSEMLAESRSLQVPEDSAAQGLHAGR
jgi:hypothetical protein